MRLNRRLKEGRRLPIADPKGRDREGVDLDGEATKIRGVQY